MWCHTLCEVKQECHVMSYFGCDETDFAVRQKVCHLLSYFRYLAKHKSVSCNVINSVKQESVACSAIPYLCIVKQ